MQRHSFSLATFSLRRLSIKSGNKACKIKLYSAPRGKGDKMPKVNGEREEEGRADKAKEGRAVEGDRGKYNEERGMVKGVLDGRQSLSPKDNYPTPTPTWPMAPPSKSET